MKALLIVIGILMLLALLPLGAYVRYDSNGAHVYLLIGLLRLQLYPKKKAKKEKKAKKAQKEAKAKEKKPKEQKQPIGGLIRDFYPFVSLALELFDYSVRKLRVHHLTLHVSFGGAEDPAKAAINYGRAWALIGSVMPRLRSRFRIKHENVSASCDFTTDEMRVFAQWKAVFFLGDSLTMALRYGIRAFKLYRTVKQRN